VAELDDTYEPAICDLSGYRLRKRDTDFLQIDQLHVDDCRARRRPLGLSERQYSSLVRTLREVLVADDLDPESCDVRLKGSSANFFSSPHKPMVCTKDQIVDEFRRLRSRLPEEWEIEEVHDRLVSKWLRDGKFPGQRPFDAMHKLGIDRDASDYDLQISCDEIVARCEELVLQLGQDPTNARILHASYNFVRKDLVEVAAKNLYLWTLRLSDSFGRGLSVAVFPSGGPPDVTETVDPPELSSHFRQSDWLMWPLLTGVQQEAAEC
jgi:hypothetical protein